MCRDAAGKVKDAVGRLGSETIRTSSDRAFSRPQLDSRRRLEERADILFDPLVEDYRLSRPRQMESRPLTSRNER